MLLHIHIIIITSSKQIGPFSGLLLISSKQDPTSPNTLKVGQKFAKSSYIMSIGPKCRTIAVCLRDRLQINHLRLLHNGPDTVEELLDRHTVKKEKSLDDDVNELITRQRLTSTRREALSLYRDIIRASRFFLWPDSRGVLWRDVLRENARQEFEEARLEKDPEVVTRLLMGGHDAVQAALDKLVEKQKQQIEKERSDLSR